MLETNSDKGACSVTKLERSRKDGAESLLERILDRNNLNRAYLRVKRNGGTAGIDGMTVMKRCNEWIRRRIRQIYWKQWKRVYAGFTNLKKLGIDKQKAWEWANSRKSYWIISDSWILHKSLTNEYLASVGYDDIYQRYKALHLNY